MTRLDLVTSGYYRRYPVTGPGVGSLTLVTPESPATAEPPVACEEGR